MENSTWILFAVGALALWFLFRPQVPKEAVLSPADLRSAKEGQKDLQLIDVRTAGEFRGGRIAGAKNIPLGDLGGRLGELSKGKPLIVYCHGGNRSAVALGTLRKNGFTQAKHLAGGITAWQGAGLPLIR
jgi:rhodanese-related sulfurtransferase